MATFARLTSVRRKGRYASDIFLRRRDGEEWALEVERAIDRGVALIPRRRKDNATFGDLTDLHIEDALQVEHFISRGAGLKTATVG